MMKLIVNLKCKYKTLGDAGKENWLLLKAAYPLHIDYATKPNGTSKTINGLTVPPNVEFSIGGAYVTRDTLVGPHGTDGELMNLVVIDFTQYRNRLINYLQNELDAAVQSGDFAGECHLEVAAPSFEAEDFRISSICELNDMELKLMLVSSTEFYADHSDVKFIQLQERTFSHGELTLNSSQQLNTTFGLTVPRRDTYLTNGLGTIDGGHAMFANIFGQDALSAYLHSSPLGIEFMSASGVILLPLPQSDTTTSKTCCPSAINYIAEDSTLDPSIRALAANWDADRVDNRKRFLTHGLAILINKFLTGGRNIENKTDEEDSKYIID